VLPLGCLKEDQENKQWKLISASSDKLILVSLLASALCLSRQFRKNQCCYDPSEIFTLYAHEH
jgi:hypothetical protein